MQIMAAQGNDKTKKEEEEVKEEEDELMQMHVFWIIINDICFMI